LFGINNRSRIVRAVLQRLGGHCECPGDLCRCGPSWPHLHGQATATGSTNVIPSSAHRRCRWLTTFARRAARQS